MLPRVLDRLLDICPIEVRKGIQNFFEARALLDGPSEVLRGAHAQVAQGGAAGLGSGAGLGGTGVTVTLPKPVKS